MKNTELSRDTQIKHDISAAQENIYTLSLVFAASFRAYNKAGEATSLSRETAEYLDELPTILQEKHWRDEAEDRYYNQFGKAKQSRVSVNSIEKIMHHNHGHKLGDANKSEILTDLAVKTAAGMSQEQKCGAYKFATVLNNRRTMIQDQTHER